MANIRPPANIIKILGDLDNENDRAVALIGTALIEHGLIEALKTKFVAKAEINKMFSDRGPLDSVFAMGLMAHALGMFGSAVKKDLDLIRKIRAEFAHNPNEVLFSTPEISNRCREFHTAKDSTPYQQGDWRKAFLVEVYLLSAAFLLIATKDTIPAAEEAAQALQNILYAELPA